MTAGVSTNNLPATNLSDSVVVTRAGTTRQQTTDNLAKQLLNGVTFSDALDALGAQITSGLVTKPLWTELRTLAPVADGTGGEVLDADTGTHLEATATGYNGASVPNAGRYSWNAVWLRWVRIGETGLSGKVDADDLLTALSARQFYATAAAFFAATTSGQMGFVNGVQLLNDGVGAVAVPSDELAMIRARLNRPTELMNVGGTGDAYTADAVDGTWADDPGAMIWFTPNRANTTGAPTLSVNGGPAFPIGEAGVEALGIGRFAAGEPEMLFRVGGGWRMDTDMWMKRRILAEEVTRAAGVAAAKDSANQTARWSAIQRGQLTSPLAEGGRDNDAIFLLAAAPFELWVASSGDTKQMVACALDQFIDVSFMKAGAAHPLVVQTYPGSSATIITPSGNHLIGANALVQVFRDVTGLYHFSVISGAVTLGAGLATPVCDYTIITGGQSLARRITAGAGVRGFAQGWQDYGGAETDKFWWIEGAIGGSGLVPASNATNFWWNPVSNTPGPNALAWKAALDAAPAAQPDPAAIVWIFGQTDAGRIGTDTTLNLSSYKATLKRLLEWMQDQINPAVKTPVIICPVGAWDNDYDRGVQSVRWVEMELIAENASFYQGPAYFDLPRAWEDVHHHTSGQILLGYRLACVLNNILNGAGNPTGPTVTGIAELDGGTRYRLTITAQPGQDFTRPLEPEGIAVYQAGANPILNTAIIPANHVWAQVSATVWTLTFNVGLPFPGATVVFPYGACQWARRGRWPMNLRNDPVMQGYGNVWPLVPFKSGAF